MIFTNLGELGAAGGILSPIDLPLERTPGTPWDLTGYSVELRVWEIRTKQIININGTLAVQGDPTLGVVRYTAGTNDPIAQTSGSYEARVWCDAGGDPEPSGLFRFSIAAGPPPS